MDTMKQQVKQMMGVIMRRMPGMITCQELDAFICDYLDGSLPPRQLKIFERHLKLCEACRAYLHGYRLTIALEKRLLATPEAPPPADVPEDLIKAILAARLVNL